MTTLITETLDAKLPGLLEQFPSTTEQFIRTIAHLDPTGCQYTAWLIRTLQEEQWLLDQPEHLVEVLNAFHRFKDSPLWEGHKDLNLYTFLDSVVADVSQFINEHEQNAPKAATPSETGAKLIAQAGYLGLWEISTPEAAALFSRGKGGVENPTTKWPIQTKPHAAKYLVEGPIYVVTEQGESAFFIHFGRHVAKDVRNTNLSAGQAAKIACLFTGQSFGAELGKLPYQPGGWQLDDSDIEKYLERVKEKFVEQRKAGFFHNSQWIEPIKDEEAILKRWEAKRPEFAHTLKMAQQHKDIEILQRAGRKHPEAEGLQALANAVHELEHA